MQAHFKQSILGLAIPLLLAIVGCSAAPAPVRDEAPKITVAHPEKRQLTDHEEFSGWLNADKKVEVRSRVRGHIAKVNFSDGEIVSKGKILFELDPRPFEANVRQAEAKLKIYEAQRVAAEKDAARYKELEAKKAASKQQLEKAEADAQSLAAQVRRARRKSRRSNSTWSIPRSGPRSTAGSGRPTWTWATSSMPAAATRC